MSKRILHRAAVLLPMGGAAPIRDGGVIVDEEGEIVELGPASAIDGFDELHDHQVLMPGVLNCHVHLTDAPIEEPVPGGGGLNAWVRRLMATRSNVDDEDAQERLDAAIGRVLRAMRSSGTVAVGEVANNFRTFEAIDRSGMRCRFIHELIAFRGERAASAIAAANVAADADDWPDQIHYTVGAHAPYSVSPELMGAIARRDRELGTFLYQHLAEDPAERELYRSGGGPWRDYLEMVGAWDPAWHPPGIDPIPYYDSLGLLDSRFVAVHLADATPDELALLGSRGVRAILSPRSNLHIGDRLPDFEGITGAGIRFGFGTDGRGSNASIDVFDEALLFHQSWPEHPAGILLEALTSGGAGILGFDDLGALRAGTRPGLVAVDLDRPADDPAGLEGMILEARGRRHRVA